MMEQLSQTQRFSEKCTNAYIFLIFPYFSLLAFKISLVEGLFMSTATWWLILDRTRRLVKWSNRHHFPAWLWSHACSTRMGRAALLKWSCPSPRWRSCEQDHPVQSSANLPGPHYWPVWWSCQRWKGMSRRLRRPGSRRSDPSLQHRLCRHWPWSRRQLIADAPGFGMPEQR